MIRIITFKVTARNCLVVWIGRLLNHLNRLIHPDLGACRNRLREDIFNFNHDTYIIRLAKLMIAMSKWTTIRQMALSWWLKMPAQLSLITIIHWRSYHWVIWSSSHRNRHHTRCWRLTRHPRIQMGLNHSEPWRCWGIYDLSCWRSAHFYERTRLLLNYRRGGWLQWLIHYWRGILERHWHLLWCLTLIHWYHSWLLKWLHLEY